jgi:hypothetical protein
MSEFFLPARRKYVGAGRDGSSSAVAFTIWAGPEKAENSPKDV